jgi:NADH dehydrogenase FAD-containing subunit
MATTEATRELDHGRIDAGAVIWAAGVVASPAASWLGAEHDRVGRVLVRPDLSVPGHPEVFVIGDAAAVRGEKGEPVPGVAPAAKQMGRYVGRLIAARKWRSARTTNAIERLHEEFKRRIKTQTVLPSAETAAMLFWALLASGQIIRLR